MLGAQRIDILKRTLLRYWPTGFWPWGEYCCLRRAFRASVLLREANMSDTDVVVKSTPFFPGVLRIKWQREATVRIGDRFFGRKLAKAQA